MLVLAAKKSGVLHITQDTFLGICLIWSDKPKLVRRQGDLLCRIIKRRVEGDQEA